MGKSKPGHTTRSVRRVKTIPDYRAVLDAVADGIFLLDAKTVRVIDANRRTGELYGYDLNELTQMRWGDLSAGFSPYSEEEANHRIITAAKRAPQVFPWLEKTKAGQFFWVEACVTSPPGVGAGHLVVTIHDISDRKRVEDELTATKDYLDTVFNSIHDAVMVHDLEGKVVDVNEKMLEMYKFSRQEAIGLSIIPDYVPEDDPVDHRALWRKAIAGENQMFECRGRRPRDGSQFDAETFITKLSLPEGDFVLGTTRDITKRKATERELHAEKRKFQTLSESSPMGMVVIDACDGLRFKYMNPRFRELFECSPEETPTMHEWFRQVYPDSAARRHAVPKWMELLRSVEPLAVRQYARKVSGRDGAPKYLEFIPVQLEAGEILMTCWDITKTREAERRIRERNLVLEVLNEVMSSVTGLLDLSEIMHALERVLVQKLQTGTGGIFLESEPGERTNGTAYWGVPPSKWADFAALARDCFSDGEVIYDSEIRLVRRYANGDGAAAARGFKSSKWGSFLCISLPMKAETPGMIFLADRRPDAFGDDQVSFYATLGQQIGVAIQNARLFEEVRQSHAEMKDLSLRLVKVQEEELRHVGRELHDEIGQLLTGLGLTLEMALQSRGLSMTSELLKAKSLAATITGLVRELSRKLRPSMLDDLGLLPTLPWLFERFSSHTNVRVVFEHMIIDSKRFGHEVETAVYRIVQEALTNVARHARTTRATVRLWARESVLGVQIEDAGAGFDVQSVLSAGNGNGLHGIRERVMLLGGRFTVDARPEGGTRVTAEFPLGNDGVQ